METHDYVLNADEVNILIQVLDRTQFSKIQIAKQVVALAEKLAAPFGGLKFGDNSKAVAEPIKAPAEEEVSTETTPEE